MFWNLGWVVWEGFIVLCDGCNVVDFDENSFCCIIGNKMYFRMLMVGGGKLWRFNFVRNGFIENRRVSGVCGNIMCVDWNDGEVNMVFEEGWYVSL